MIVSNEVASPGCWIGIDVSKKWLDAALWLGDKRYLTFKVGNDPQGYALLLGKARKLVGEDREPKRCMESTGDYGVAAAMFLTEQGFEGRVVNPARVKFFGAEIGRLNKTDKADAKLISQFATERNPAVWALKSKSMRELFRLSRRRTQLKEMISMERSRRECPLAIGKPCMSSIKTVL